MRSARASPTRSPPAVRCSAASACPGIVVRAKALIDKKGAGAHPRRRGPPSRRPPLPLHRLRQDPRRGRAVGAGHARCRCPTTGGIGARVDQVRGHAAVARRPRLHRRHAACPACCTARSCSPTTPEPRSSPSTRPTALAAPGVEARLHRGRHPRRAAGRHHPHRLAGDDPGRRAAPPTSATSSPSSWPTAAQSARDAADLVRGVLRRAPPAHRSGRRHRRPRDRGVGHRLQRAQRVDLPAGRRRRRRWEASAHRLHEVFQTQRIEHAFLEPESTLAVPPSRRRTCTSTPAARACGTTATRSPRCSALSTDAGERRAGVQRWRLRRQGGHEQPGADRAGRVDARGVRSSARSPASSRCSCTRSATRSGSSTGPPATPTVTSRRSKRAMIGDSGSYASVGMKVLERAAGHAGGPYRIPNIDVEAVAVRTNNPAVRRLPRVRCQPGPVRDGRRHRPAGRDGRASAAGRCGCATSSTPATCGDPARSWTTGARGPTICLEQIAPAYDAARRRRARRSDSGSG